MTRNRAVTNQNHEATPRHAAIDVDPCMAKISPDVIQSQPCLGANCIWSHKLQIWIDDSRQASCSLIWILMPCGSTEAESKLFAVPNHGINRMPTLGREPSSLHPFDELLYGRLTELCIAFDQVFLANPVLLENGGFIMFIGGKQYDLRVPDSRQTIRATQDQAAGSIPTSA